MVLALGKSQVNINFNIQVISKNDFNNWIHTDGLLGIMLTD